MAGKAKAAEKTTVTVPKASIELLGNGGFKIQLEKLRADALLDQSGDVLISRGQGCISSPTGPTC